MCGLVAQQIFIPISCDAVLPMMTPLPLRGHFRARRSHRWRCLPEAIIAELWQCDRLAVSSVGGAATVRSLHKETLGEGCFLSEHCCSA